MEEVEEELSAAQIYKPNDLVWIKISGVWWVAEVQDMATLDPEVTGGLKKTPLVVVKFLLEDTYEFVRSYEHIYHYNCRRKEEFLKIGFKKYYKLKNETGMAKFPLDIQEAERRTGGNPDIVNDPQYLPQEAQEPPKVENRGKHSLPAASTSKVVANRRLSAPGSWDETTFMKRGTFRIKKQGPSWYPYPYTIFLDNTDLFPKRPSCPPSNQEVEQRHHCNECGWSTPNLGYWYAHLQYKQCSSVTPTGYKWRNPMVPSRFGAGKKLAVKAKKNVTPRTTGKNSAKKKKEMPPVPSGGFTPPKKKKTKMSPPATPNSHEVSMECAKIIEEWTDDEEEKNMDEITENARPNENSVASEDSVLETTTKVAEVVEKIPSVVVPPQKVEKPLDPPKSSSCFDFDDEPLEPGLQSSGKFGQIRLPRVITPEKSKPPDPLDDGNDIDTLLREVSVPEIPSLPPSKQDSLFSRGDRTYGSSPKKPGLTSPVKSDSNDTNAEADDNKNDEKHFLAEGPLQSKKRKSFGRTEGAEDGSVSNKKLKVGTCPKKPSSEEVAAVDMDELIAKTSSSEIVNQSLTDAHSDLLKPDNEVMEERKIDEMKCDAPNERSLRDSKIDETAALDAPQSNTESPKEVVEPPQSKIPKPYESIITQIPDAISSAAQNDFPRGDVESRRRSSLQETPPSIEPKNDGDAISETRVPEALNQFCTVDGQTNYVAVSAEPSSDGDTISETLVPEASNQSCTVDVQGNDFTVSAEPRSGGDTILETQVPEALSQSCTVDGQANDFAVSAEPSSDGDTMSVTQVPEASNQLCTVDGQANDLAVCAEPRSVGDTISDTQVPEASNQLCTIDGQATDFAVSVDPRSEVETISETQVPVASNELCTVVGQANDFAVSAEPSSDGGLILETQVPEVGQEIDVPRKESEHEIAEEPKSRATRQRRSRWSREIELSKLTDNVVQKTDEFTFGVSEESKEPISVKSPKARRNRNKGSASDSAKVEPPEVVETPSVGDAVCETKQVDHSTPVDAFEELKSPTSSSRKNRSKKPAAPEPKLSPDKPSLKTDEAHSHQEAEGLVEADSTVKSRRSKRGRLSSQFPPEKVKSPPSEVTKSEDTPVLEVLTAEEETGKGSFEGDVAPPNAEESTPEPNRRSSRNKSSSQELIPSKVEVTPKRAATLEEPETPRSSRRSKKLKMSQETLEPPFPEPDALKSDVSQEGEESVILPSVDINIPSDITQERECRKSLRGIKRTEKHGSVEDVHPESTKVAEASDKVLETSKSPGTVTTSKGSSKLQTLSRRSQRNRSQEVPVSIPLPEDILPKSPKELEIPLDQPASIGSSELTQSVLKSPVSPKFELSRSSRRSKQFSSHEVPVSIPLPAELPKDENTSESQSQTSNEVVPVEEEPLFSIPLPEEQPVVSIPQPKEHPPASIPLPDEHPPLPAQELPKDGAVVSRVTTPEEYRKEDSVQPPKETAKAEDSKADSSQSDDTSSAATGPATLPDDSKAISKHRSTRKSLRLKCHTEEHDAATSNTVSPGQGHDVEPIESNKNDATTPETPTGSSTDKHDDLGDVPKRSDLLGLSGNRVVEDAKVRKSSRLSSQELLPEVTTDDRGSVVEHIQSTPNKSRERAHMRSVPETSLGEQTLLVDLSKHDQLTTEEFPKTKSKRSKSAPKDPVELNALPANVIPSPEKDTQASQTTKGGKSKEKDKKTSKSLKQEQSRRESRSSKSNMERSPKEPDVSKRRSREDKSHSESHTSRSESASKDKHKKGKDDENTSKPELGKSPSKDKHKRGRDDDMSKPELVESPFKDKHKKGTDEENTSKLELGESPSKDKHRRGRDDDTSKPELVESPFKDKHKKGTDEENTSKPELGESPSKEKHRRGRDDDTSKPELGQVDSPASSLAQPAPSVEGIQGETGGIESPKSLWNRDASSPLKDAALSLKPVPKDSPKKKKLDSETSIEKVEDCVSKSIVEHEDVNCSGTLKTTEEILPFTGKPLEINVFDSKNEIVVDTSLAVSSPKKQMAHSPSKTFRKDEAVSLLEELLGSSPTSSPASSPKKVKALSPDKVQDTPVKGTADIEFSLSPSKVLDFGIPPKANDVGSSEKPVISPKKSKDALVAPLRSSRWDQETSLPRVSPLASTRSPGKKGKVEIKSGYGRSCFKSSPTENNVSQDVQPAVPARLEPDSTNNQSDDELSALQAEIMSYSEMDKAKSALLEAKDEGSDSKGNEVAANSMLPEAFTASTESASKSSEDQKEVLSPAKITADPTVTLPPQPVTPVKPPGLSEADLLASLDDAISIPLDEPVTAESIRSLASESIANTKPSNMPILITVPSDSMQTSEPKVVGTERQAIGNGLGQGFGSGANLLDMDLDINSIPCLIMPDDMTQDEGLLYPSEPTAAQTSSTQLGAPAESMATETVSSLPLPSTKPSEPLPPISTVRPTTSVVTSVEAPTSAASTPVHLISLPPEPSPVPPATEESVREEMIETEIVMDHEQISENDDDLPTSSIEEKFQQALVKQPWLRPDIMNVFTKDATEKKVYEAKKVTQLVISLYDEDHPDYNYYMSLPPCQVGTSNFTPSWAAPPNTTSSVKIVPKQTTTTVNARLANHTGRQLSIDKSKSIVTVARPDKIGEVPSDSSTKPVIVGAQSLSKPGVLSGGSMKEQLMQLLNRARTGQLDAETTRKLEEMANNPEVLARLQQKSQKQAMAGRSDAKVVPKTTVVKASTTPKILSTSSVGVAGSPVVVQTKPIMVAAVSKPGAQKVVREPVKFTMQSKFMNIQLSNNSPKYVVACDPVTGVTAVKQKIVVGRNAVGPSKGVVNIRSGQIVSSPGGQIVVSSGIASPTVQNVVSAKSALSPGQILVNSVASPGQIVMGSGASPGQVMSSGASPSTVNVVRTVQSPVPAIVVSSGPTKVLTGVNPALKVQQRPRIMQRVKTAVQPALSQPRPQQQTVRHRKQTLPQTQIRTTKPEAIAYVTYGSIANNVVLPTTSEPVFVVNKPKPSVAPGSDILAKALADTDILPSDSEPFAEESTDLFSPASVVIAGSLGADQLSNVSFDPAEKDNVNR